MKGRDKGYKLLLPLLLISTFIYAKYEGGFISWFLFYAVIFLSLYILVVVKYSLRNIKITRTFNKNRLTVGDELEVELLIWNHFGFPHPHLIVEDILPEKIRATSHENKKLTYPWFNAKTLVKYKIPFTVRGKYEFTQIELLTGDVFGIVNIKRVFHIHSEVLVYPKIYPIKNWHSRNNRNIGNAFSQNKISEDTSSVIGVRDYRSGDRFNRIHWKHSAKNMHLMTKEFEKQITNDFMLLLNKTEKFYEKPEHFEAAIILAGSIAKYAIDQHFLTGFVYQSKESQIVPLSRGQEHLLQIFELLAIAEPIADFPFKLTVLNSLSLIPRGTTLLLITPILTQELAELLIELSYRKIKVEVFVIPWNVTADGNVNRLINDLNIDIHVIPASTLNIVEGGIAIG